MTGPGSPIQGDDATSVGGHILRALGIAVAAADADLAAEVSQP